MSKISKLLLLLVCILSISACTVRKNIIKIHDKELKKVFGDYTYEYKGIEYENGYDGLGSYRYKRWEISFTDPYGNQLSASITNDKSIDKQINNIYKNVIELNVYKEILSKCFIFNNNQIDYDEIQSDISKDINVNLYTKEYNYKIYPYVIEINTEKYYDKNKQKITNYDYFVIDDIDLDELVDDDILSISSMTFKQINEKVLSSSEYDMHINYIKELCRNINTRIPTRKVHYAKDEYFTNKEGKQYISSTKELVDLK